MSKLETLEADFQPQVVALLKEAEAATGRSWGISDGRRTLVEQALLYAQGRTAPGKVVTMAKPGESAHNFGYAVDLWPLLKNGKEFDWGAPAEQFKKVADLAQRMGLIAGYYFQSIHDAPHIESRKWKECQAQWRAGKLQIA